MSGTQRILLFETSALLATLSMFTDHYTHDPEALERLMEPASAGQQPSVDRVLIPDHVVYELTGILPLCFPQMLEHFAAAKHDEKALSYVIDLYALASPRGEVNDPTGDQKSHVRMLLRFIANHPDAIVSTETGRAYCQRLKADYAVLGTVGEKEVMQYRPTFSDAFHYLGDRFAVDGLRVHAGQLLMMGMISETQFNERISRIETPMSKQQRFYKTAEFLDKMVESENGKNGKNGNTKHGFIPHDLAEHIKRKEGVASLEQARNENNGYLKSGLFRRHPQLLRLASERFQNTQPSGVILPRLDDEALFQAAFGPSRLLMEHYVHGGIIPNDNRALLAAADALGFDTQGMQAQDTSGAVHDQLYQQGFYEVSPTLAQLKLVHDACVAAGIPMDTLGTFVAAIPGAERAYQQSFREACRHPNEQGLAHQQELRMPYIGLAYEKVFGDALINGAISWNQFQQLVQNTGGLPRRYGEYIGSQSADILLFPGRDAMQARVLIAQDGFVGRTGKTLPNTYISRATKSVALGNEQRVFYDMPAAALIERCRNGLIDKRVSSKLYRSFETMLYRPSTQDAVALRNEAVKLLGEDRVVQLEKDFANRHARRSLQVQPPYRSLFAALHTNGRILRKNLGEVATAEAVATTIAEQPGAHVWVVNHDSDLFCDDKRNLQLEDSVIRQHAGLNPDVLGINDALRDKGMVHMVNTEQFLDSLHMLMGRPARKRYEEVSAKPIILNHRSRSWASLVHEPIAHMHQR